MIGSGISGFSHDIIYDSLGVVSGVVRNAVCKASSLTSVKYFYAIQLFYFPEKRANSLLWVTYAKTEL